MDAPGPGVDAAIGKQVDVRDRLHFYAAELTADAGWDAAASGCDYVLHVASPVTVSQPKNPDELIVPARDGTRRAIGAGLKAGVKRVVLTSSVAAISRPIVITSPMDGSLKVVHFNATTLWHSDASSGRRTQHQTHRFRDVCSVSGRCHCARQPRPYQRTPHSLSRCTVLREVVMGTRRVKKPMVDSLVLAGRCPERQSCLDQPVIWLMSDKWGILDTFFEFHSSSLLHLKGETLWLGKHRVSSRSPSAWKSTPTPAPTCKRRGFKAVG